MKDFIVRLYSQMLTFVIDKKFVVSKMMLLVVHAILLIMFLCFRVYPLFFVNIGSILWYVICSKLSSKGYEVISHYMLHFEVIAYSIFSVYLLGFNSGFAQYLIALVPISLYALNNLSQNLFIKASSYIMACIEFVIYIVLYNYDDKIKPLYVLDESAIDFCYTFASSGMFIAITACCFIFSVESKRVERLLRAKNSALTADAQKDPLTGLLNRRGFMPIIQKFVNERKPFAVAICDIDNFKRVNDTYGHDAGDAILREITSVIKREANGHYVCRWGGEEIVVAFEGFDIEKATHIMELARDAVEKHVTKFADKEIKVTITVGVEQQRQAYHSDEEAITIADKRLYYGKHNGKNIVVNDDRYKEDELDEKEN